METKQIEVRSLHHLMELEEVRKLERKIWGALDTIPSHQTITAVKNGGLVLGAFYGKQLVGFQYSFPGFNGTSAYLCSHILGIDAQFRNKGIGEKLKLAQRNEALKLGYSLITWTYDPLESINGYLNIAKLGGICSTYIPNCYGDMEDLLNKGISTDRFLIEWHINQTREYVTDHHDVETEEFLKSSLLQWDLTEEGIPFPTSIRPFSSQEIDVAFVAIPKNFRSIRETNMEFALEWRLKTREIFITLFQQGWTVTGFKKTSLPKIPVNFYILSKKIQTS